MTQVIWIEIPVVDFDRALKFYHEVFQLTPSDSRDDGIRKTNNIVSMTEAGLPGVSINLTKNFEPSDKGILVYLLAGDDLSETLGRVEGAGGKIVEGKTSMEELGFYSTILDSEGNMLALYSQN